MIKIYQLIIALNFHVKLLPINFTHFQYIISFIILSKTRKKKKIDLK